MGTADGRGALNYTVHKPVGVVAVIAPWNLPFLLLTWKVAPALACGNTVVAKPSEETPSSAALLAEVMQEVGVPPGAFTPPPKVDSDVVRMLPLGENRPRARDEALFAAIVAAAFSQRRKTLRNAVKALVPAEAFERAGIDAQRRGETLSVGEFIALADAAGGGGVK